jgi:uncharacterized integral membrane protein (TIGR00697 family)
MPFHESPRAQKLFIILTGIFVCNALMAEFIGVKIFALETTLGIAPFNWNLFGQTGSLNFTAGVLLWPVVFIMTDVVNEYFGRRGVRLLSWLTVLLIGYAFVFAFIGIGLAPAPWWVTVGTEQGVPDMQAAYASVFGQGQWTIAGSMVAFMVGQLIDVAIYHRVRRATGEGKVWLRATGSTLVSQLVDSFIVLYIAFVLGPQRWSWSLFFAVATVNYVYKFIAAIAATPLIYASHRVIDGYLGRPVADEMKERAAAG